MRSKLLTEAEKISSEARPFMSDDLQIFHERDWSDLDNEIARQLVDLGNAVTWLREGAGLTRGELARQLRVKSRDIAVVEDETPRAPAALLEAALSLLARGVTPNMQHESEVWLSMERIRQLRPALLPACLG
jgi:hypothetical protein